MRTIIRHIMEWYKKIVMSYSPCNWLGPFGLIPYGWGIIRITVECCRKQLKLWNQPYGRYLNHSGTNTI